MAVIFADDGRALQDSVRRLLADFGSEAEVRRVMETERGYDPELWRRLCDLGVAGVAIEEAYGGSGGGAVEVELIMEEAGAALLCAPLLSSAILSAELLRALGDEDAKRRLLPGIAAGTTLAAAAPTGDRAAWTRDAVAVAARAEGAVWRLDGHAGFVLNGQTADVLLVLAEAPDGLGAFEVDPQAAGVTVRPLPTFDHTLRLARIELVGVQARRIAAAQPVWDAVRQALDLALVALAGEQAGGARRCLEFTVDYAKARYQFGRAIGSFQAVKHMAADLLLESESAISAARHAAQRLADGAADARAWVSLAAFACADAFNTVTATSIQMHGGIAFTWAHPAHLYLRRARADAQLFGAPAQHRERYIQELGG